MLIYLLCAPPSISRSQSVHQSRQLEGGWSWSWWWSWRWRHFLPTCAQSQGGLEGYKVRKEWEVFPWGFRRHWDPIFLSQKKKKGKQHFLEILLLLVIRIFFVIEHRLAVLAAGTSRWNLNNRKNPPICYPHHTLSYFFQYGVSLNQVCSKIFPSSYRLRASAFQTE